MIKEKKKIEWPTYFNWEKKEKENWLKDNLSIVVQNVEVN